MSVLSLADKEQGPVEGFPKIEDRVTIGTGAQVLGNRTLIGHDSMLGNLVTVAKSVPPFSRVFNRPQASILSNPIKDPYSIERLIGNTPLV